MAFARKVIMQKKILSLIVCCSVLSVWAGITTEQQQRLEKGKSLYIEGRKWVDRSLCKNIALSCNNNIQDKYISTKDKNIRITIIDSISESSGSYYVGCTRGRKMRVKTRTSAIPIGSFNGHTSNGGSVSGTLYGQRTTSSYKAGCYETRTTEDMIQALAYWKRAAGYGHPQACAEYAAAMFIEAAKGDSSNSKMYKYFKLAADGGVLHARFMQAICLYYGIGITRDQNAARKLCESWFNDYCQEVVEEGGGSLDDLAWREKALNHQKEQLARWNRWATRRINEGQDNSAY